METLYVEVNNSEAVPLNTQSVIFLYNFCACNHYKVVQVDTQEANRQKDGTGAHSGRHLPHQMVDSTLRRNELPDIVKSCELPAVVDAHGLVCYTGLCTVLRRIVMSADAKNPSKNIISLLGFRQTSLKTCSEVSLWTKVCEVQAPKDITNFLKRCRADIHKDEMPADVCIPEAIQIVEENLCKPVVTFNAVYRQQRLKKGVTTDTRWSKNGPRLGAAYKNAAIITDKRKYKQSCRAEKINQEAASVNDDSQRNKDVLLAMSQVSLSVKGVTKKGASIDCTLITDSGSMDGIVRTTDLPSMDGSFRTDLPSMVGSLRTDSPSMDGTLRTDSTSKMDGILRTDSTSMDGTLRTDSACIDGTLRTDSACMDGTLRTDSASMDGTLRTDSASMDGTVRTDSASMVGTVRTDSACMDGTLRTDSASMDGTLRTDSASMDGALRTDSTSMDGALRTDPAGMDGTVRTDSSSMVGTVRTNSACMDGTLRTDPASRDGTLRTDSASMDGTLRTDWLSMDGSLRTDSPSMDGRLRTDSASMDGTLRTDSASMDGTLRTDSASMDGTLRTDSASMDGTLRTDSASMDGTLRTDSASMDGTVRTDTASMDGTLRTTSSIEKSETKLLTESSLSQGLLPPLEHTFAEGPDLTLADLALFPSIQAFLTCLNRVGCREIFKQIPFVLQWYKSILAVPNVIETATLCGLTVLELTNENGGDLSPHKMKQKTDKKEADFGKGKSRKAIKAAIKRELPAILSKLKEHRIEVNFEDFLHNTELDWGSFSDEVNPCQDVDEKRARDKRNQVASLVSAVEMIAQEKSTIVDFCSGGGHVGIVLAYLLPQCHVVMIENNEESLRRAASRVQRIGLANVSLYQSNIDYYSGKFDIGVSLHACGVATDLVLAKCQLQQAAFVCSPCCYGGLKNTHLISYPRSQMYREMDITCEDYFLVGHAAEQTSWNFETEHSIRGKLCMGVIDTDRALTATEEGYKVHLCSLQPTKCSPKNNLLVGWPKDGIL